MPSGKPKKPYKDADYFDEETGQLVLPKGSGGTAYPDLPEGENARLITAIITVNDIAKHANVNDIDSLYWCFEEYLNMCRSMDIKITNMSAYAACGIGRDNIKNWIHGLTRRSDPRYREFAMYVNRVCAEYREMLMSEGKLNPITGIWWQKNYDSFSDKPAELPASTENEELTSSEIADKYRDLPDE